MQSLYAKEISKLQSAEELFELLKEVQLDHPLCFYTLERCQQLFPLIEEINELKKEKNALILAHSYVHPDIIYTVADHTGDSFGLSMIAGHSEHSTLVFPSVRFMAETAKILNPTKMVIDPNPMGGCSLADSITAVEVRKLKALHPDFTFICYINTTAEVKAECDVCVTSSNVYKIIENIPSKKLFFLPDTLMGKNLQEFIESRRLNKILKVFEKGSCYVHEEFDVETIHLLKHSHKNLTILAHPECSPSVVAKAQVVGSTTGLMDHLKTHAKPGEKFLLLTECGIASRLKVERPDIELIGSCMVCKYMKSNHLEHIRDALLSPENYRVELDPNIQAKARKCLDEMFELSS
ncbi:MAG: quinolinate synthase NadA [Chlamydiae bacterium]|nr:quinolinate synthase NadA [Chlamydiota bacterium]